MHKKIKVGLVGLGRMGKEYAQILNYKLPELELAATCSIIETEIEWAKKELKNIQSFSNYDEMLSLQELEAVVVASSTNMHADHMIGALKKGLHVFCEKPLAPTLEACQRVQTAADQHPDLLAMVGFVRRFDASYRYAKDQINQGVIGKPFLVKSQTVDKDSVSDFQIKYVDKSGGIFHDYNIHDIDLARWLLNSEVESVYAIGGSFKYPKFEEKGDADNVMTSCQFKNGSMAVIGASRTAMHGHDTYTEVVGTEGTLRIGRPANKNRVEIYDKSGIRAECVETFWERFEDAFSNQLSAFAQYINTKIPCDLDVANALNNTKAAIAFTSSFKKGKIVHV